MERVEVINKKARDGRPLTIELKAEQGSQAQMVVRLDGTVLYQGVGRLPDKLATPAGKGRTHGVSISDDTTIGLNRTEADRLTTAIRAMNRRALPPPPPPPSTHLCRECGTLLSDFDDVASSTAGYHFDCA